ncbi:1-deoxy-D-xylulose-5-phosphate synthase [Pseudoramibacter alactolyticus]
MKTKLTDTAKPHSQEKPLLKRICKNGDIRNIPPEALGDLAAEIRRFLIEKVGAHGGHLSANLGVVELTMALHLVFDFAKDRIVWDVGHQAYVHKILTGRKDAFDTLREYGGLSGFPKKKESPTDCFDTGHGGNSVSAGLGMACACELAGSDDAVVAVIGDGSSTSGMFYEALNCAGRLKRNFIIILNDNEMSISRNISGLARYLSSLRAAAQTETESTVAGLRAGFAHFGITYFGPIDGHDVPQLVKTLQTARRIDHCVIIHTLTQKGRGYLPAERYPDRFHGIGPFDIPSGVPRQTKSGPSWTDVFASALMAEAAAYPAVTAITAAMADGTGLKAFASRFPERFFDVGIAEEHGVTFAAGLAAAGRIPVVAIYSTFLQRAYDQVLEDVCLQKLHVVFAIDRAGIVGQDGETHQGIFDVGFLSGMPNMTVIAPKNAPELEAALHYAIHACDGPVAIRYGRGPASRLFADRSLPFAGQRSEPLLAGKDATLLAVGHMNAIGAKAVRLLAQTYGITCGLVNARFLKPLDEKTLAACAQTGPVITLEDNVRAGGFGERTAAWLSEHAPATRTLILAIDDIFVAHGSPDALLRELALDPPAVAKRIAAFLGVS